MVDEGPAHPRHFLLVLQGGLIKGADEGLGGGWEEGCFSSSTSSSACFFLERRG